ncbi:MAG: CapA family protein [Lachnospira sp.]|nr:CapA family protein [Lachnospira sp.]
MKKHQITAILFILITACVVCACATQTGNQDISTESHSSVEAQGELVDAESTKADKTEPETIEAESTKAENTEKETETVKVEPTKPSATEPESIKQEVAVPDFTVPEGYESYVLTFAGDCTLGTMPSWMSYQYCFNKVIGNNYNYPFQNVRKFFVADDCTFINLESVLAESGTPENKQFTFRGPVSYVNIMTGSSVEFANLANNHTYDFGQAGYTSTKQTLESNNVAYVETNSSTLYTTKSGLKIGVYGVYFSLDKNDMVADVTALKNAGADVIVAAAHWGIELEKVQNSTQSSIAHQLIDAGVDIVWGHHPHILQPIEKYNGGITYYSLGNFSFGGNHNPSDKDTAVIQQQVLRDAEGKVMLGELKVIPCSISTLTDRNDFRPTPYAVGSEAYNRVFKKLKCTQ